MSSSRIVKFIGISILTLLIIGNVLGQSIASSPTDTYTPSGMAPGSVGELESINLYNGNLSFSLPIKSVGGRGDVNYSKTLIIENHWQFRSWQYSQGPGSSSWATPIYRPESTYTGIPAMPKPGDVGKLYGRRSRDSTPSPSVGSNWNYTALTQLTFTNLDGSEASLRDTLTDGLPKPCQQATTPNGGFSRGTVFKDRINNSMTFISDAPIYDLACGDTSFAVMNGLEIIKPSGWLYFHANGLKFRIENGDVTSVTDRNGNVVTGLGATTDVLGRSVVPSSFNGFAGQTRSIQVVNKTLGEVLQNGFSLKSYAELFPSVAMNSTDAATVYNPQVVAEVILSDGRKYKFSYTNLGQLAKVEQPTGGRVEYDWESNVVSVSGSPQFRQRVKERREYLSATATDWQSRTIYNPDDVNLPILYNTPYGCRYDANDPTTNCSIVRTKTLVRNPDGSTIIASITQHYYHGDPYEIPSSSWQPYPKPLEGREFRAEVYDENQNMLRISEKILKSSSYNATYNSTAQGTFLNVLIPTHIYLDETKETLVDGNLVKSTKFSYDSELHLTDSYEYDYGSGTPGAFLRRTHTDYVTDQNYLNVYLKSLPSQTWVSSDINGASIVARTQTEYDNYANDSNHASILGRSNVIGHDSNSYGTGYLWRGNPTKVTNFENAANQTGAVSGYYQYDMLGNIVKTIDGKGNISTIGYDDNFGGPNGEARTNSAPSQLNGQQTFAYATSTTNPKGWTIYSQFDYFTGEQVDTEDINGNVSSMFYNDPLDRPTQTITANNTTAKSQISIVYDDVNHRVQTTSDLFSFGDNISETESFYDGLGRTYENHTYRDGTYIITKQEFDGLGRVKRATNPYKPGESQLWTTTSYDALSRPVSVTAPDNSVITTTYSGNVVTATDQAGKQNRSITNGLQQLIRIDEPDDSGNLGTISNPNQSTYYFYDTLGRMIRVQQGVQNRYFKYDSLGRLLRVRQPEQDVNANLDLTDSITGNNQWTAGFTYDANGNLLTSLDSKNITVTNTYDNLNRVLTRVYSDGTAPATYTYDDPNIQFSKGHLTRSENAISASQIVAIDNSGRVLASQQITDGNTFTASYQFNLSGMLVEETYPTGRKVKNTFEADGDMSKIETQRPNQSWETRAQNFSTNSSGALSQLQFGNGLWQTAQFNNRLQVTQLGLGTSPTDTSVWKMNYEFGELDANDNVNTAKNNGNIARQTVTSPIGTYTQSFKYDSLERLKEAKETSGGNQTWIQNFTYDRYGNRIGLTQTINGQTSGGTPMVDVNTNRFTTGQGYTYDFAGNIVQDNQGRQFIFNGDNKQVEVRNSQNQIIGQYFYDAEGKRIKKVTNDEITVFVYSGGNLIAEYSAVTAGTQTSPTPQTQYQGTDLLGSLRVITNQSANVVSRRDLMPFGEDIPRANYGSDNNRNKFTTYQKDNETGLDFAEARYYNNAVGRFTAVDPLLASGKSANPQTFNRYAYAGNNPITRADPSGMDYYEDGNGNVIWHPGHAIKIRKFHRTWTNLTGQTRTINQIGPIAKAIGANVGDTVLFKGDSVRIVVTNALQQRIHQFLLGFRQGVDETGDGALTALKNTPINFLNMLISEVLNPPGVIHTQFFKTPQIATFEYHSERAQRIGSAMETGFIFAPSVIAPVFRPYTGYCLTCEYRDLRRAEIARDALMNEKGKDHAAYVGGYKDGKVVAGHSNKVDGCCENSVARQLGEGVNFTDAYGWRKGQRTLIPVCILCQDKYKPSQFLWDVKAAPGGSWQK